MIVGELRVGRMASDPGFTNLEVDMERNSQIRGRMVQECRGDV